MPGTDSDTSRDTRFDTHQVGNQPPAFFPRDLWQDDIALRDAVLREGAGVLVGQMASYGALAGDALPVLADEAHRDRCVRAVHGDAGRVSRRQAGRRASGDVGRGVRRSRSGDVSAAEEASHIRIPAHDCPSATAHQYVRRCI